MKNLIASICSLILLLAVSRPAAAQSNSLPNYLLLDLTLNKHTYLKSEPVFATVTLANFGDSTLRVRWPYLAYDYFEMYIKDAKGKEYPYFGKRQDATDSVWTVPLAPRDSEYQVLDLLPLFGSGVRALALRQDHTRTCFLPGSYTIQAGYERKNVKSFSQILTFEVAEPEGKEREAYKLLTQASDLELDYKIDEAAGTLDALIKKYPKSAYHVQAFLQKMHLYERSKTGRRKAYDAANALIQAHPSSEAAVPALSFMLIQGEKLGKTEKENKRLLTTVVKRYPNTLLSRWAMKALSRFQSAG